MMLFSSSFLLVLLNSPDTFKIFGQQSLDTILIAGNYGAFKNVGDYFTNTGNPLLHTWSLAVEEQIYLFLPIFIFLILSKKMKVFKMSLIIFAAISVISLYIFLNPTILDPVYDKFAIADSVRFSFYSPIHRLWQFTIGGLGFLVGANRSKASEYSKFSIVVPPTLIVAYFWGAHTDNSGIDSVFASFLVLCVVYFRSLDLFTSKIKTPLAWIGDRSYSIYLFHMPLIYIANTSPYLSDPQLRKTIVYLSAVLSVFIGAISYSMVENKFRMKHRDANSSPRSGQILTSLLVLNLAFSLVLIRGSENNYWGIERKVDRPAVGWSADPNCARMSGELDSACVYLNPSSTGTVLLVGDSHAAQFSQAIVDAAQLSNWNSVIWTMAGCNFA
jgi:peptidoglycan/LPS O-acetylase OafA/YrhL